MPLSIKILQRNLYENDLQMIQNNQELEATLAGLRHFQKQIEKIREVENIFKGGPYP